MHDLKDAQPKIAALVELLSTSGGLRIAAKINEGKITEAKITARAERVAAPAAPEHPRAMDSERSASETFQAIAPEAAPEFSPGVSPDLTPEVSVDLFGPDTPLLLSRNAELLHAIEHLAAKILRLEPEEHDRISFDAAHFKANRDRDLRASAVAAIARVRAEGRPYTFPPMSSRERRLLHLAIAPSGLRSASTGEGPRRCVVLYPDPA